MKKVLFLMVATMLVIGMAGGSFAATTVATQNIIINAVVSSNCSAIVAGTLSLAIDPTTVTEVDSTGNITKVQCTSGNSYLVSATSAGSGNTSSSGTLVGHLTAGGKSDIPYTLYFTPSFGGSGIGGASNDITLIVGNGSSTSQHGAVVAQTDANAAEAGSFSDQVTLTVAY